MKTFFAGTNIEITTTSGAYINALVNGIKNDTLYLQQFIVAVPAHHIWHLYYRHHWKLSL